MMPSFRTIGSQNALWQNTFPAVPMQTEGWQMQKTLMRVDENFAKRFLHFKAAGCI
jgi:hypothetical protein